MPNKNLTRAALVAGAIGVLSACMPAQAEGYRTYYPNSSYYGERYPDGYYRASDGRRFATYWERDAYQARLNAIAEQERARLRRLDQRDRNRYRDDLSDRYLTPEERARRQARRERRRLEREREAAQAERERRRAQRRQREAERNRETREERRRRRRAEERARELERRAAEIRRRNQLRTPPAQRRLPEGWSVIQKDGKTMYMDTEGRIRSGF